MSKTKDKVYVVRDRFDFSNCFYTEDKVILKAFLKLRDPDRYEWVRITKEKDIERTRRLFSKDRLIKFNDIALSQTEFEYMQDELISLQPCIMADLEKLVKALQYIKFTENEQKLVVQALKTVHDLLYSIEEPPAHMDGVIDETFIFNEAKLAKKFLIERCL